MARYMARARFFNRISLGIVNTYSSQCLKKRPVLYPFRYCLNPHYMPYVIDRFDHCVIDNIIHHILYKSPIDFY